MSARIIDFKTRLPYVNPVRQIFTGPNEIAVELCERLGRQISWHNIRYCSAQDELITYVGTTHCDYKFHPSMPFPMPLWLGYDTLKRDQTYKLHCSNTTDPFMWMDRKYEATLRLLIHCRRNKIHLDISTQSDLIACDDYISQLDKSWLITLCFPDNMDDEEFRAKYPGCPSQLRLKKAYEKLKNLGLNVHMGVI